MNTPRIPNSAETKIWMEAFGRLLRIGTPLMIGLLIYIYQSDQKSRDNTDEKLFNKIDDNAELIKDINDDVQRMVTELARRGVVIDSIQKEVDTHYILIQDHEGRIRTMELSPRNQ